MPDRYQESHLRRVPLFKNLSEHELSLVAQASMVRRYNADEYIFQQGETTRGLHVFIDGRAILFRSLPTGQNESLRYYQNGDYINDSAMFNEGTQTASLIAEHPVTAILITREAMANLLSHHPEIRAAMGLGGGQEQHLHAVHFKTQRENEEVLLSTRRHWWAYIRYMWIPIVIAIPLWVMIAIAPVIAPVVAPLSLILVLIAGGYLYFEWANDSVTITDQRVVRITHTILTFREVRDELAIESIQEANAEIPAFDPFAWVLRYGQIQLKTAGKEGNFTLDFMPKPEYIQDLIMEGHQRRKEIKDIREREAMRADLDRWINNTPQASSSPPHEKQKNISAADQDKIENFWTEGDGPLSPFMTKFPTDEGGTVYRKHWSIWLKAVILPGLWIIAGLAVLLLSAVIPFLRDFGAISFGAAMVMLLFGSLWFYYSDWDWRHDYYVVTDKHIIIIDQKPLFMKNENEQLMLKQVDNVAAETKGIWQRFFKYGDVRVALIGADEPKLFDNIADPIDVQNEITRRRDRMKQQEATKQEQASRDAIGEYLSLYHESVGQNIQPEYTPPDYVPRATDIRDANRQQNVPQQYPPQPSMSEGRPYEAHGEYGYTEQAQYRYPNEAYNPQPNNNPPLPQDDYGQQQYNYNQQQGYYQQDGYVQQQQNINRPLPYDTSSAAQQSGYNNQQEMYADDEPTPYPPYPQDGHLLQFNTYNQQTQQPLDYNNQQQANMNPPLPLYDSSSQQGSYNQQANVNPPLPQTDYNQQQPNLNPPLPPMENKSQSWENQQQPNMNPPLPPEKPASAPPPPPNLNPPPPKFNRGRNVP